MARVCAPDGFIEAARRTRKASRAISLNVRGGGTGFSSDTLVLTVDVGALEGNSLTAWINEGRQQTEPLLKNEQRVILGDDLVCCDAINDSLVPQEPLSNLLQLPCQATSLDQVLDLTTCIFKVNLEFKE
jgi:hypothetical protein